MTTLNLVHHSDVPELVNIIYTRTWTLYHFWKFNLFLFFLFFVRLFNFIYSYLSHPWKFIVKSFYANYGQSKHSFDLFDLWKGLFDYYAWKITPSFLYMSDVKIEMSKKYIKIKANVAYTWMCLKLFAPSNSTKSLTFKWNDMQNWHLYTNSDKFYQYNTHIQQHLRN